ncbi:MAG TPA: MFS transporter [Sphingomonas sp.]|nr:MFS transporter [Sphingomonas sp.]
MAMDQTAGQAGSGWRTRGTRNPAVILGILYLLNMLLVLDKVIFTVLLEPIKAEFRLSDLQLGFLTGSVYAVFMGIASLPMGLAADRYSRRGLAAGCLAAWSAMTAMCGMAQSYATLLLARLGVGVGEAGGGPVSLSIIAELYEHRRRATAMAIFALGTPTAALINLTLNTQIVHHFGWRVALFCAAVPGLLLALAIWLFVDEFGPVEASTKSREKVRKPPLRETAAFVLRQRSLVHLLIGAMTAFIVLAGVSSWNFSYLVREFKANLHEIGPYLGVSIAAASFVSMYLSARLADFLGQRDERWRGRVMAVTTAASVGFGVLTFTTDSLAVAIVGTAGIAAFATLWMAPAYALCQSLVPPQMRGTIGATMFLLANLVGYGIGPMLVGFLSDRFGALGFDNSLQVSIIVVLLANLLAAFHFLRVGVTLEQDLQAVGEKPRPGEATGFGH